LERSNNVLFKLREINPAQRHKGIRASREQKYCLALRQKKLPEIQEKSALVRRSQESRKKLPLKNRAIAAARPKRHAQFIPSAHSGRLTSVMRKIESGLPHSVRELALEVKMTPDHLQRLFKQETGLRLGSVISERKLGQAAHLLSSTDVVVKEVAYTVGYRHPSSFVRAFRRRFGQSPTEYRQRAA
jgi:AraC-like DNA-binding protein